MSLFDTLGGLAKSLLGNEAVGGAIAKLGADMLPTLLPKLLGQTALGDVGGLLARLQQGGLDAEVSSWLGSGANLPVSGDQIRAALGNQNVQEIAKALQLPVDLVVELMSAHLPQAIDTMSPNGVVEQG